MPLYYLTKEQAKAAQAYNLQYYPNSIKRNFACGEVLGNAAYELSKLSPQQLKDEVFSILQPSGAWQDYKAIAFKTEVSGLRGYVLLPEDKNAKDVKVVFRGTATFSSLRRDFEMHGPGSSTMALEKDNLMNQLDDILANRYGKNTKDIHLSVAGHSLGASDAENFSAYLCQKIAKDPNQSMINHLSVYSYNSPGISLERSEQSVKDASHIKQQNPDFKIQAHFAKSEHDVIQQLGESHLFREASFKDVNIDVLEMKKKDDFEMPELEYSRNFVFKLIYRLLKSAVQSHTLSTFFTPDEEGKMTDKHVKFKYLNSKFAKHHGEINSELHDKAKNLIAFYRYAIGWISYFVSSQATQQHKPMVAHHKPGILTSYKAQHDANKPHRAQKRTFMNLSQSADCQPQTQKATKKDLRPTYMRALCKA